MVYLRTNDPEWNNFRVSCDGYAIKDWFAVDDLTGIVGRHEIDLERGIDRLWFWVGEVKIETISTDSGNHPTDIQSSAAVSTSGAVRRD